MCDIAFGLFCVDLVALYGCFSLMMFFPALLRYGLASSLVVRCIWNGWWYGSFASSSMSAFIWALSIFVLGRFEAIINMSMSLSAVAG